MLACTQGQVKEAHPDFVFLTLCPLFAAR